MSLWFSLGELSIVYSFVTKYVVTLITTRGMVASSLSDVYAIFLVFYIGRLYYLCCLMSGLVVLECRYCCRAEFLPCSMFLTSFCCSGS